MISQETIEVSSGASSALFIEGEPNERLKAMNFPVEAGKTYTLSYDYKVKTGSETFGQQVIGYKYGGVDFSPYSTGSTIPQSFEWTTRTFEIDVTETEDWQFEISLGNFIDEPYEVYIDNISFKVVVPEPDRSALVAFCNATDGDNWTNSWDLDTPYNTWFGVQTAQLQTKSLTLILVIIILMEYFQKR